MTQPNEDTNPPVWWRPGGAGAEAYYIEHYEDIEARYQRWCRENQKDPESVGSMIEYEAHWL